MTVSAAVVRGKLGEWFRQQAETPDIASVLTKAYHIFSEEKSGGRGFVSLTEFANWVGISNSAMSQYMNQSRTPTGEMVGRLADKLGNPIMLALGRPPVIPDDKMLRFVARYWDLLDKEEQAEIMQIVHRATGTKPLATNGVGETDL